MFMKSALQPAISDFFRQPKPTFSIEFFPPKDEQSWNRFSTTARQLAGLEPDFVSITYGAGGTTRERTLRAARELKDEHGFVVMPHLTCVGSDIDSLLRLVEDWLQEGFRNIMALRGDPPKGQTSFVQTEGGLRYASDLVALLKKNFPEACLGVGGYPEVHPEAPNAARDLRYLREKCAAGADFVTTQLFFDNHHFERFVADCRAVGINQPILAGIMPVLSLSQVKRFTTMCGASLPEALLERLEQVEGSEEAEENAGIDWACEQIAELLQKGTRGVHLYALNRARAAITLSQRLPFQTTKAAPGRLGPEE